MMINARNTSFDTKNFPKEERYYFFDGEEFMFSHPQEIAKQLSLPNTLPISEYSNEEPYEDMWSARLSTGAFGLTSCPAGNRGPKEYNEVILAKGDKGLKKLVGLGFITCPVCNPEETEDFFETVGEKIQEKYGFSDVEDFANKDILPLDARRVNWEELLPVIGKTPGRLYLPNDLNEDDLTHLHKRFNNIGYALPKEIGCYDKDSPGHFREYPLSTYQRIVIK